MASPPLRRLLCRAVVLSALAALGGAPVAQALSFMPAKDIPRAVSFGGPCVGCDLSGRALVGAHSLGADFSGSALIGADLRQVRLLGADFSGSDLSRSDLSDAKITGADFDGARMKDIRLDGVRIRGASFAGADFEGPSLRGVVFCGVDLGGRPQPPAGAARRRLRRWLRAPAPGTSPGLRP